MASGIHGIESSSTAISGHKQGVGLEVESAEIEQGPIWDVGVIGIGISL